MTFFRKKYKIFFVFILSLILSANDLYAYIDRKNVIQCVQLYEVLLSSYSGSDRKTVYRKNELIKLFDESVPQLEYPFDLFDKEEADHPNFLTYLDVIKNVYKNQLDVEFDDSIHIKCTARVENKTFVFATVRKTIKYAGDNSLYVGKKKTITLLIGINVTNPEYKISLIKIPEEYDTFSSKCTIRNDQLNRNDFSDLYRNIAEEKYNAGQYVAAKEWFEKALLYQPNEKAIREKLTLCNSRISCDDYNDFADGKFNQGNFSYAMDLYRYIDNNCRQQNLHAQENIDKCLKSIRQANYDFYVNDGNYLYKKRFYSAAQASFKLAINYSQNEQKCLEMIEKCAKSPDSVINIIKNAVYIAEHHRKEWPEVFKTFSTYEESGFLSGDNYYFMSMMLNGNDNNIGEIMNFTGREQRNLAREYCLKAMIKGNTKAEQLWKRRMIK